MRTVRTAGAYGGALAFALIMSSAVALADGPISAELTAIGGWSDPHNIRAVPGDTVNVAYRVSESIGGLASFQTDVSDGGSGEFLGVVRGEWFSGEGSYGTVVTDGTSGAPHYYYRVLGYCFGFPTSISGCGDLAVIAYRYDGPGTVTLNAAAGYTAFYDDFRPLPRMFAPVSGDLAVTISREPCDCYDKNRDRKVNVSDLSRLCGAYGSSAGDVRYDADFDANGDGRIDVVDLSRFSPCYGSSW